MNSIDKSIRVVTNAINQLQVNDTNKPKFVYVNMIVTHSMLRSALLDTDFIYYPEYDKKRTYFKVPYDQPHKMSQLYKHSEFVISEDYVVLKDNLEPDWDKEPHATVGEYDIRYESILKRCSQPTWFSVDMILELIQR